MSLDDSDGASLPASGDLYEDAACGLLVTAADGTIRSVNRTFCLWLGWPAAHFVGRVKVQDLLTIGGRIFHQTHWAPLLQIQGSVAEVKLEIVHADGHRIPMVWNAVRRERDGIVRHEIAVFVAEDRHRYERELLMARKRAEELLEKEQAALLALSVARKERDRQQAVAQDRALFAEQMMAIVSHDLRNPLAVMRMSAHLVGLGHLSDKQRRALARLDNANARATRLISDLLDFSQGRVGSGLQLERRPMDLHALVEEGVEDLRVAFPASTIEWHGCGSGACNVSADRLVQLMGNLVTNAVAYGDPNRPIAVRSTVAPAWFSISVGNEGPPIPDELLARLFDPMTRGVESESAERSVGLGLFIVREIARAHDGEVTVTSSALDGTIFEVRMPRDMSTTLTESSAPLPAETAETAERREQLRQAALDELRIGPQPEAAYDDIVRLAAEACDAPIALISLVDGGRQWFKARTGLAIGETPREHSFCSHAIENPMQVMVVEDASADPRFASNPLVTGDPHIRFYAGAPLVSSTGQALGTVCVIDPRPRGLNDTQVKALEFLAAQAVARLEGAG